MVTSKGHTGIIQVKDTSKKTEIGRDNTGKKTLVTRQSNTGIIQVKDTCNKTESYGDNAGERHG